MSDANEHVADIIWQDEETRYAIRLQQQHQQQQQQQQHAMHGLQSGAPPGVMVGNNSLYMAPDQYGMSMHHQGPHAGDNFTVLPMGNGNYLKVYRNQDESMNFSNYELFSSNPFIGTPHPTTTALNKQFDHHHQQQQQQQQHQQMHSGLQEQPFFHSTVNAERSGGNVSEDNTNNMFINQLVENWVPNVSGTYLPFGEPPPSLHQQSPRDSTVPSGYGVSNDNFGFNSASSQTLFTAMPLPRSGLIEDHQQPQQQQQQQPTVLPSGTPVMSVAPTPVVPVANKTSSSGTNGSFQHDNSIKKNEVKKTRMVAEVKPMRMTYSDVLSKNVFNKKDSTAVGSGIVGNGLGQTGGFNIPNGATNVQTQTKSSKILSDKNRGNAQTHHTGVYDKKSGSNIGSDRDDGNKSKSGFSSSSSSSRNDESPFGKDAKNGGSGTQSSSADDEYKENKSHESDLKNASAKKKGINGNNIAKSAKSKSGCNDSSNKKRNNSTAPGSASPTIDFEAKLDDSPNPSVISSKGNCFLYNIYKNESVNKNQSTVRKSGKSVATTTGGGGSNGAVGSTGATASATRSNSKTEKTNSYQKRNQRTKQKNKYDMVAKLLEKWLEYLLRFLTWLVSLVYDVVVLSGGMIWERVHIGYDYSVHLYRVARKELKQNSGLPTAFFKSWWQRFDRRFAEDSKWAFWRRIFNRKKPTQQQSEYVRSGRLPTTGDEAMCSLLNCKGKDAYSILGVSADCSQEQVRKHYKKIAVLVHPDKNKQAGAEEAFKILQRAFELIGEPENRQAYDKSLAEALNAEKACSEINDLLTQLQSKIAEAANTIRCSSCGLRHPRRPTGRPHFAARECNSCKIRHTAREGDIWAETTVFGFRWKYLALMEGKVYDITEWANCQKGALAHLQPNSHTVQYRIVLGGQQQQQQQQQQNQQQQQQDRDRVKNANNEPTLDDFLANLYSGQNPQSQQQSSSNSRRRTRKN